MVDVALMEKLAAFSSSKWHRGQLLALSGIDAATPTDYEGGLVIRTTENPPGLEIVYPGCAHITFGQKPEADIIVSSDFFFFRCAQGEATGCILDAHHFLISGPFELSGASDAIRCIAKDGRCLVGAAAHFDPTLINADLDRAIAARSLWVLNQPILNAFSGTTRRILFKALSVMKGQVCLPEGAISHRWTTPDRWPHKDMWLWDSVFHAIGWRHIDPVLARDMIDAVFDGQQADGFIPHQNSPTRRPSNYTQPPILSYGVKLVTEILPDVEWVRRSYAKLSAYIEWDLANRDKDGVGLVEWFIEGDPTSRSGESGMDNSPRFDFHYPTRLAVVDFNSYLALECEVLSEFANALGYTQDAALWQEKRDKLCSLINRHLWSDEHQFYSDYDPASDMRSPVLSSAGFLPLICGAATPERAAALARHLRDSEMFATAFPVPSITVRDKEHYSKDMWRGPTWVNVNWLIARGLERYTPHGEEFAELAQALDAVTVAEVERTCGAFGTFFEYFDDRRVVEPPRLLRKGICDPRNPFRQVIHDYGWTTTLYVDLVSRQTTLTGRNAGA